MKRYVSFCGFNVLISAKIDIIQAIEDYFYAFLFFSEKYFSNNYDFSLSIVSEKYDLDGILYGYKENNVWGVRFFTNEGFIMFFEKWSVVLVWNYITKEIKIYSIIPKNLIITSIRLIKQIFLFNQEATSRHYSVIHASSFVYNNKIVIISSPCYNEVKNSGYGKSMAVLSCLFGLNNISFFSDDNIILSNNFIFSYPDLISIEHRYEYFFPKMREYGHVYNNRRYLSVRELNRAGINIDLEKKEMVSSIVFVDFRKKAINKNVAISRNETISRLLQSVRYDFMFSELYNPNWLEFKRKTKKEIEFDSSILINELVKKSNRYVLITGFKNPIDIVNSIKDIIA